MVDSRLRNAPIFKGLSDRQLLQIIMSGSEQPFLKGDGLFLQGEVSDGLFIVLRGRVKLVRSASNGAAAIIEISGAGDELTAFSCIENRPYSSSAKALTDGSVFRIPGEHFRAMSQEIPALGANILRILGARYHDLLDNFTSLAAYKVEGRLCIVMSQLARRYGILGDTRGVILDLALTRQDLADIAGTTLETTIRTLNRLRQGGLLTWEGKRFFIPDLSALDNLAIAS